jgi:Na+/melibiose symporter-like transporter
LLSFGGLGAVLICDLCSFFIAFVVLLFFIRIPKTEKTRDKTETPFLRSCTEGFHWLRGHKAVLFLSLFMMLVNLLAKLGDDGIIAPFVLARSEGDVRALGAVQSCTAIGVLIGSLLVTGMKPAKNKPRLIFLTCALVFTGNVVLSLSSRPWIWCAAVLYSYMAAAMMGANLTAYVRERVPIEVQGRVFSAKDTLQNGAIPLGLFLGGVLADRVFEPFMAAESPVRRALAPLFGTGKGAGIAVLFCIVGVLGVVLSLTCLTRPVFRQEEQPLGPR